MIKLFKNKIFILSFLILAVFGFAKSAFASVSFDQSSAVTKINDTTVSINITLKNTEADYVRNDAIPKASASTYTNNSDFTTGTLAETLEVILKKEDTSIIKPLARYYVKESYPSQDIKITFDGLQKNIKYIVEATIKKDDKITAFAKGFVITETGITAGTAQVLQGDNVISVAANTTTNSNNSENLNYYPLAPITGIGQDNCTQNPDGSKNCVQTANCEIDSATGKCKLDSSGNIIPSANGFGTYFNAIIKVIIGIAAVLAMIMIIAGGIEYMTSGSASGSEEGKKRILGAIMGLLIALGSYALLNTINSQLLDVSLSGVPVATVIREKETSPWTGSAELTSPSGACKEGYVNVSTFGQPAKINVCKSMSDGLTKMLAAAKDSNIILSGWGSRSIEQQRTLRAQHGCPNDSSPPTACHPPTAQPGTSKHESGKAVDFNCNGAAIGNTSCFTWLKQNASTYGFKNLDSEPWHWSDNGY